MLSKKLAVISAIVLMFGCLNIASAGYDTGCNGPDPYSKFNNCCCKTCPDYPDQFIHGGRLVY